MRLLAGLFVLAGVASAAHAGPAASVTATAWLGSLREQVARDLAAGRPLVVHAHVALCDNHIIRCGGHGLGDGDSLATNLYWATTGGFHGWFARRGSGWTEVAHLAGDGQGILETRVWRRRITPGAAWRALGVKTPFDLYVVADAWRGLSIDQALEAYVTDLYGDHAREIPVAGGVTLAAGGAAQVVGWVGHNRWMDRDRYDFAAAARRGGAQRRPKGTLAVACKSADYLGADVPAATRVPLLMTSDFLFAGAYSFEGAVRSFAEGGSLAEIRAAAAKSYAEGEKRPLARVRGAFTNPSDPRWLKPR